MVHEHALSVYTHTHIYIYIYVTDVAIANAWRNGIRCGFGCELLWPSGMSGRLDCVIFCRPCSPSGRRGSREGTSSGGRPVFQVASGSLDEASELSWRCCQFLLCPSFYMFYVKNYLACRCKSSRIPSTQLKRTVQVQPSRPHTAAANLQDWSCHPTPEHLLQSWSDLQSHVFLEPPNLGIEIRCGKRIYSTISGQGLPSQCAPP